MVNQVLISDLHGVLIEDSETSEMDRRVRLWLDGQLGLGLDEAAWERAREEQVWIPGVRMHWRAIRVKLYLEERGINGRGGLIGPALEMYGKLAREWAAGVKRPGMDDLMEGLRQRGMGLVICSNAEPSFVYHELLGLGMAENGKLVPPVAGVYVPGGLRYECVSGVRHDRKNVEFYEVVLQRLAEKGLPRARSCLLHDCTERPKGWPPRESQDSYVVRKAGLIPIDVMEYQSLTEVLGRIDELYGTGRTASCQIL